MPLTRAIFAPLLNLAGVYPFCLPFVVESVTEVLLWGAPSAPIVASMALLYELLLHVVCAIIIFPFFAVVDDVVFGKLKFYY